MGGVTCPGGLVTACIIAEHEEKGPFGHVGFLLSLEVGWGGVGEWWVVSLVQAV